MQRAIVCGVDGSEAGNRALSTACWLAWQLAARLVVVHVAAEPAKRATTDYGSYAPFSTMKPGQDALRYDLRRSLSDAERRRLEPLEGRALVLQGKTADREGNVSAGRAWNLPLACGRLATAE